MFLLLFLSRVWFGLMGGMLILLLKRGMCVIGSLLLSWGCLLRKEREREKEIKKRDKERKKVCVRERSLLVLTPLLEQSMVWVERGERERERERERKREKREKKERKKKSDNIGGC